MNKKTARRKRDLKTKLLAAVAMLLVSSLMMVTTTYAWFTLSTAPEVTGITTAVGANGNLEMALQPYSGDLSEILSAAGDGALAVKDKNITWGNLVDVSDNATYGMNNIVLYPAALNGDGTKILAGNSESPLVTPVYGADGRINELRGNTTAGAYDSNNAQFAETLSVTKNEVTTNYTNAKGVRAIGTSSSLTARELAHRAAMAAAVAEKGGANTDAGRTLNQNGSAIAEIAIKHALLDQDSFTWGEIQALYTAVTDMEAIAGRIEKAMINYLLAYNIAPGTAESKYAELVNAFNGVTTLAAAEALTGAEVEGTPAWTVSVPSEGTAYATAKTALSDLKADIGTAKTKLAALNTGSAIAWSSLSDALAGLANLEKITVGGFTIAQLNETEEDAEGKITYPNRDTLVATLTENGFTANIVMPTESGVFADLADFVGNYSGSFKTPVNYNGMNLPINTVMTAEGAANYLSAVASMNGMTFVSATGGSSSNPISTFYGYIIDLAFRTNAANSYLQLQADAIDRIYEDGSNESTMGHGASMTFKTDSKTFGSAGVKSLMENIRIIFFNTATGDIYAHAQLDSAAAETNATSGEIKMPIVLTGKTDNPATQDVDESTHIMALNQNEAHALSVMVYLDGNTMTNADVAADVAKSMSGSMNLQFSSSAQLKPMEYNDLRNGTSAVTPSTPEAVQLSGVTSGTEGYEVTAAMKQGDTIGFQITGDLENKTVTVDFGNSQTATATPATAEGQTGYVVTIPSGVTVEATTPITITVTPVTP